MNIDAFKEGFLKICESNGVDKPTLFDLFEKQALSSLLSIPKDLGVAALNVGSSIASSVLTPTLKGLWDMTVAAPGWVGAGGLGVGATAYLLQRQIEADKKEYERRKGKLQKYMDLKQRLTTGY